RALHSVMDDGGAVRGALIGHLDPRLSRAEQHVRLGDRTGFVRDRYRAGGLRGRIASDEDRFGHRELFAGVQTQGKRPRLRLLALGWLLRGLLDGGLLRRLWGVRLCRWWRRRCRRLRWRRRRWRRLRWRRLRLRWLLRLRVLLRGRRSIRPRRRPRSPGDHTARLGSRRHLTGGLGHTRHCRIRWMSALLPGPCRCLWAGRLRSRWLWSGGRRALHPGCGRLGVPGPGLFAGVFVLLGAWAAAAQERQAGCTRGFFW